MATRMVIEWHCSRCGDKAAVQADKDTGWRHLAFLGFGRYGTLGTHDFTGPLDTDEKGLLSGDLCPKCRASLVAWWHMTETVHA